MREKAPKAILAPCLLVEDAAEPIQGRVRARGHPSRAFYGWLELAAALEGVRRRSVEGLSD